jgi:hypothetical protein
MEISIVIHSWYVSLFIHGTILMAGSATEDKRVMRYNCYQVLTIKRFQRTAQLILQYLFSLPHMIERLASYSPGHT